MIIFVYIILQKWGKAMNELVIPIVDQTQNSNIVS